MSGRQAFNGVIIIIIAFGIVFICIVGYEKNDYFLLVGVTDTGTYSSTLC